MGVPFVVLYVKKVDSEDSHGETDGINRTIKLKLEDKTTMLYTMIHEYTHAVLHVTGQTERLTEEHEESIVVALEHGMFNMCNFNTLEDLLEHLN